MLRNGIFTPPEYDTIDWKLSRIVASSLTFLMPASIVDLTERFGVIVLGDFLRVNNKTFIVIEITNASVMIIAVKLINPPVLVLVRENFLLFDNSIIICNLS